MTADGSPTFDIFGAPTAISFGYISSDRGYVQGVTRCEANDYAKKNPGTVFIVKNRDFVRYLDINEVNKFTAEDMIPKSPSECSGIEDDYDILEGVNIGDDANPELVSIKLPKNDIKHGVDLEYDPLPCRPRVAFFGGGGVGVHANPVIGNDGAVLAVDVVRGGFGYKYPPQVEIKDTCNIGVGADAVAFIDEDLEILHYYDENLEVEEYKICGDDKPGYGRRYDQEGKNIGPWDPEIYRKEAEKTPYQRAVDEYNKLLREYKRPWKTCRGISVDSVVWTADDIERRTTKVKYDVKHPEWGPGGGALTLPSRFKEDTFLVYTEGGKGKGGVHATGLKFTFKSEDGTHTFAIEATSFVNRAAAEPVNIKVRPNTVYNVVSTGNYKGINKTEQGLLKESTFGTRGGTEQDRGTAKTIFTDLIGSADDDDDLQVKCTLGQFTAGKGIATGRGHDSWAITYKLEDNSINNANAGSNQGSASQSGTENATSPDWDSFMNAYAISPIPPSNVPGSDYGGTVFSFTWDCNFPTDGEYIFRGCYDGSSEYGNFYVDSKKIGQFKTYDQKPFNVIRKVYKKGPHTLRFDLKNNVFMKPAYIQPTIGEAESEFDGRFIKEGNTYFYIVEKANDLVSVKFELQWAETADRKMTVTKATLETEDEPLVFEVPKLEVLPPASLPNISMAAPWIKSYQGDTNWVNNPRVEFLRTYAVFPVHDNSLNGVKQTGIWTIDITTPGTYTIELSSDDTAAVSWDGNFVGDTTWNETQFGPKVFTINNVSSGKHQLKGEVTNNPSFGRSWKNNPGGIAWILKNPAGQIVRTSLDEFNTDLPEGYRAISFDVQRKSWDVNKIMFDGMNFTASGDIPNDTTNKQNTVVQEGIAYKLSYWGSGGRPSFFKVEYGGGAIGLDDDGGKSTPDPISGDYANSGVYVGANLLVVASEGEFYEQDGSFYYKVRKSNLEEDLGKGSGYEPKGNIVKTGTFKVGQKYKVVLEQEPDSRLPKIKDTGIFNNQLTDTGFHDDQIMSFSPIKEVAPDGTITLVPDPNAILAARSATQLSEPKKVSSYGAAYPAASIERRSIFNTKDWIDKANRELWKFPGTGGFLGKYGIVPFDTNRTHDSAESGTHNIIWYNVTFPVTAVYKIEIQVDDNVRLSIGDQVNIYKRGFTFGTSATTYDSFGNAVEAVNQGKFGGTGKSTYKEFIEKGTYTITAALEQIPGGELGWDAGKNSMVVGVNIEADVIEYEEVDDSKSWNENPLGVAFTIESPIPLPPVQTVPKTKDGECPPNPIWTTRYPGANEQWYPVIGFPFWSKFLNRYALSPVPPIKAAGSDGTGVIYSNTWTVDLPYAGQYGLKGAVDNWGRILIDGAPWQRFSDEERSTIEIEGTENGTLAGPVQDTQPLSRVHLDKGEHTITVEVENWKNYEIPQTFIDKKIFNTADWQSPDPSPKKTYVDVNFDVKVQTLLGASIKLEGLFEFSKDFGQDGIGPPPPPETEDDVFRVYHHGTKGMIFTFIARDGKDQFKIEGDDYPDALTQSNVTPSVLPVKIRPNVIYDVIGSKPGHVCEQGLIHPSSFGKRGSEKDSGTSTCIFTDATSSSDDDDDLQIETQNGLFTAGSSKPVPGGGHDSWHLTYMLSVPSRLNEQTLPVNSDRYRNVHENFIQKVEKGKVYNVVITSTGKERLTGEGRSDAHKIVIKGLKTPGDKRWTSNTLLEFDDNSGNGWDTNASFTITKVEGGKASFATDGNSINVTGKGVKITLTYNWNDRPSISGKCLDEIRIGSTVWTQTDSKSGSVTRTITLDEAIVLGGDGSKHFQLRTQGDNVIQMEDLWGWEGVGGSTANDTWFKDVICAASEGTFFDIQGNTAKYVIGRDLVTTSVRNGVVYKGPKLYNYKHRSYGTFLNSKGVSPDYPVVTDMIEAGTSETINYEWSNIDFDVEGEYEFHFAHDAHGSVYLDGKEIMRGVFDNVAGVSAIDLANFTIGQKKKVLVSKGKHTITVAPSGRIGDKTAWADGLFRKLSADYYRGQQAWENNASALAVSITRKHEVFPEEGSDQAIALNLGPDYFKRRKGKSWYENPIAISAALIPAPCKTPVRGKGVVTRVEILDPGVSYPPPEPPKTETPPPGEPPWYPTTLILTKLVPPPGVPTGIGYTVGVGTGGGGITEPPPPPPTEPPTTEPPPDFPPGLITPPTTTPPGIGTPGGGEPFTPEPPPPPTGDPDDRDPRKTPPGIGTPYPPPPITPPDPISLTPPPPGVPGGDPWSPPPGSPPPGDPQGEPSKTRIVVEPANGASFEPEFDEFGRLTSVRTIRPGIGFTEYPNIRVESPGPGINAKLIPVFRVVRDPIYLNLSADRLIQVTDLVGIKQTGYYDGRPYYGAVFYKQGVRYAGYFETAGDLIRVYDTLQESIDARSVTPPSAIQRQGTDINSNDPRLNIPDTPENLI